MDSIADILASRDFSPPEEVKAIKAFVAQHYDNRDVSVKLSNQEIIIMSRSAGLIGSLRLNAPALARAVGTTKRIRFRIG
ncbi:MAG: hypothetical protein ACREF7_01370 [Candidatus Saccharimonadales bacterium]